MFARARPSGALEDDGGRVEIRYKPADGRLYYARVGNLKVDDATLLPDEACRDARPVERAATGSAPRLRAAAASSAPKLRSAAAAQPEVILDPVPQGAIVAYADGACSGNPGPAGAGVVLETGDALIEISRYLDEYGERGTNNIGELSAVDIVLDEVPDSARPLVIRTDSKYVIDMLTKPYKVKANRELVMRLRERLTSRPVVCQYVPGHRGVVGNERADALAVEAWKTRRSWRQQSPRLPGA